MKDAVLTIRLPSGLRSRVEELARREGRSLSQQAERLIERGIGERATALRRREPRELSGLFRGSGVPTLADFRRVRSLMSESLGGERRRGQTRR